jgi:hypothetical protein
MPKFHVKNTFMVEGRPYFVLAGTIMEGTIRPGMVVGVPFHSSLMMTAQIDYIEFARRLGGHEDTCLCIRCDDPDELAVWRGMNLVDETLEVVAGDISAQPLNR